MPGSNRRLLPTWTTSPVRRGAIAQLAARLDGRAQRLLDQDVLAGLERLQRRGHVELVGDGDDHRLDLRVGQHGVVIAIGHLRLMDGGHPLAQVVGEVADRVELGIPGLAAGVEVGKLRDRAAAQHADAQAARVLGDHQWSPG